MQVVCITGIDGAGKSTLAKDLTSLLKDRGMKARYIYGRTVPLLSRVLMGLGRLFFLKNQDPRKSFNSYSVNKKRVMRQPILRFFYKVSILNEFFIEIWVKMILPKLRNEIVLVDRYIYDTVISDLAVHLGYSIKSTQETIDFGMRFIPRPNITVFLDIPEDIALLRKTDIPHPDYLIERQPYFMALTERPEVRTLDGNVSCHLIIEQALELISSNLGWSS